MARHHLNHTVGYHKRRKFLSVEQCQKRIIPSMKSVQLPVETYLSFLFKVEHGYAVRINAF